MPTKMKNYLKRAMKTPLIKEGGKKHLIKYTISFDVIADNKDDARADVKSLLDDQLRNNKDIKIYI